MADTPPFIQTEEQLASLVGQTESLRLEFKASALLSKKKDDYVKDLSKEISAFANTEGGQIVIGIAEGKAGKTKIAARIDGGIDPSTFPIDQFQQAVQSNVSPYLPGLRFIPVRLIANSPGRIAIVIVVPRGATAYQANDRIYYGRSEFECEPLRDHSVRLLMMRSRVAIGEIGVRPHERIDFADVSHYRFSTELRNLGELTIRRFSVSLEFSATSGLLRENTSKTILLGKEARFNSSDLDDEPQVFPSDTYVFPREEWRVILPSSVELYKAALRCKWKLFLDDAPASFGEIDLSSVEFPLYLPPGLA